MKIKCEYCSSMIEDTEATCPNCGAPNPNVKRTVDNTPKTIEELKKWYADRHLPPEEKTRFFIGKDYKGAKAFGIYKFGDEFIVYKNKSDGSRSIRYRGTDEAYAVNEIFLKLKSEILNQKNKQPSGKGGGSSKRAGSASAGGKKRSIFSFLFYLLIFAPFVIYGLISTIATPYVKAVFYMSIFILIALVILWLIFFDSKKIKKEGLKFFLVWLVLTMAVAVPLKSYTTPRYYTGNDSQTYVKYENDWYQYDYDYDDYYSINSDYLPAELIEFDPDHEYDMDGYSWSSNFTDFFDSDYYDYYLASSDSYYDSDSDWGSSSDWDSDWDWDSGSDWDYDYGSDWDSDW